MSLYLLHYLYSYLPIHQNPFLCLFVDIYNLAMQDENLRSERFVTSVILNGKGEEVRNKAERRLEMKKGERLFTQGGFTHGS